MCVARNKFLCCTIIVRILSNDKKKARYEQDLNKIGILVYIISW